MSTLTARSRSQGIAMAAILSAVYVSYALLSSYLLGAITHGADNFIVRSLAFVILIALTSRYGYSTIMGGISGLVLEFTVPTPVRFYILPSLFAYGFVFDIISHFPKPVQPNLGYLRVLIATILASITMSTIALTIFTLIGFFPSPLLPLIWGFEISTDVALGIIGAIIGLALSRRFKHLKV